MVVPSRRWWATGFLWNERLAQAVALLPANVFRPQSAPVNHTSLVHSFPAPEHVKPNAYALVNERIGIREGDKMNLVDGLSPARARRIRGMIRLRDAVRRCLRAQIESADEDQIQFAREQLNGTYDRFVARHGPVSEHANTSAFRGDPDLPLLLSLEHYDPDTRRATKAAIFRERTVRPGRALPRDHHRPGCPPGHAGRTRTRGLGPPFTPAPPEAHGVSSRPQGNHLSQSADRSVGNRGRIPFWQRAGQTRSRGGRRRGRQAIQAER